MHMYMCNSGTSLRDTSEIRTPLIRIVSEV